MGSQGWPDHGDEEDALVLAQAPAHDGDEAQEDDRDAGDVDQAKDGDPPIPSGQQQHREGDDEGEQDAHHSGLDADSD